MNNPVPTQQQILDNEHLKLLSIFHYVMGGISALLETVFRLLVREGNGGVGVDYARSSRLSLFRVEALSAEPASV